MGYTLKGVRKGMGKIISGVYAPLVTGSVMVCPDDPVDHRVTHVYVTRCHVDLCPQNLLAFGKLSPPHPLKEVKVLLNRAVSIGAFLPRFGKCSTVLPDLLCREIIHIGPAFPYQLYRTVIEPLEIIRGIEEPLIPVKPQPAHILDYRSDILLFFFKWIGIIKPEVAEAAVFIRYPEVQADGLGMPDVKVAIGLRRKSGMHPASIFACFKVFFYYFFYKVFCFFFHSLISLHTLKDFLLLCSPSINQRVHLYVYFQVVAFRFLFT